MSLPPAFVLLIEDSSADVRLVQEAFLAVDPAVELVVRDTAEAGLQLLRERYDVGHCPDLVLLDVNLPGDSGLRLLEELKAHARLCRVPVVMFTASHSPDDVVRCYDAGANSYVAKPDDFDGFLDTARAIATFWLKTAVRPPVVRS